MNLESSLPSLLLLANLRTGHPVLDSVLLILFSSLVTFLTAHFKTVSTSLLAKSGCTISIDRYQNQTSPGYDAISWYLSTRLENCNNLQYFDDVLAKKASWRPAKNTTQKIQYEGETLHVKFCHKAELGKEKMITVEDCFIVTYYGKRKGFLTAFMDNVIRSHNNYLGEVQWKQQIWYLERGGETLYWNGRTVENHKTFSNIIMDTYRKKALEKDLRLYLNSEALYKKRGVSWCRGYLFHGEPGCGKTSLIKAIANEVKYKIYSVDLGMIKDDQEMRTVFRGISSQSVVVFEDIDASAKVVKKRQPNENGEDSSLSLSVLLNELDGISNNHGRILIMTTNHLESLDPALIRPGRIDFQMELKKANMEEIALGFEIYTDRKISTDDLDPSWDGQFTIAEMCNKIVKGELL